MRSVTFKVFWFILFSTIYGCNQYSPVDQNSNQTEGQKTPVNHTWETLGLQGKLVPNLVIVRNYLFACATRDGLFRLRLDVENAQWEYLGFADSTLVRGTRYGVVALFFNPIDCEIIMGISTHRFISEIGVYKSRDFGHTWVPSDSGIRTVQYPKSSEVASIKGSPLSAKNVLLGLSGSIYKSTSGGQNWKRVWGNQGTGLGVKTITFHATKPNSIWAGGETSRFQPYLLYSVDLGETWQMIFPLPPLGPYGHGDNAVFDVAIDHLNEGTIYVGMGGLIIKTHDYGQTWKKILGWEDGIYAFWKLAINPKNTTEVLATGARLYRTRDSGSNWEKVLPPDNRNLLYALAVDWEKRILYTSASSPGNGIYKLSF